MTPPSPGTGRSRAVTRRYAASVAHCANLIRARARDVEATSEGLGRQRLAPPLDHPSARDAVTLLGWQGPTPVPVLEWALGISQSANVRLVDRLQEAGLVDRYRDAGDRRVWVRLTPPGESAAADIREATASTLESLVAQSFPDTAALESATVVLERLVETAVGADTDAARFCCRCDVSACLQGGQQCPSARACAANLAARG